jgi:GNAT superfamily N-acetyltransferase
VARRVVNLTLDNLDDVAPSCRSCVFWELDAVSADAACRVGGAALEKEAWLSDTLLQWGSCGQIAYIDGEPAGSVLYAPAAYVPRSTAFPTSPVSPDAVLLMSARVREEYRGAGLGRVLVQSVVRDLSRRGVRAVEAFGRTGAGMAAEDAVGSGSGAPCLLPAEYLLAVGFKTVRAHHRVPRLRLDVKATVSWREEAESALERLLGAVQTPTLARG